MKPVILVTLKTALVFLLFSAGQSYAENKRLIVSDTMFTPDATVSAEGIEKGKINGVSYQFYLNEGYGDFAGVLGGEAELISRGTWSIHCEKDAITDKKSCWMAKASLFVRVNGNGTEIVSIGFDHFPYSTVTIRIDDGKPITSPALKESSSFTPSVSKKIINKLQTAVSITTRSMVWPDQIWDDRSWDLYGFNESMQFMRWAVKHIK